MGQSACRSQYFNDLSQIGFSIGEANINVGVGLTSTLKVTRPFIPIVGVLESGSYDSAINNIAFGGVIPALFAESYQASINNVNGLGTNPSIATGAFDQYLYKSLFQKPDMLVRYEQQANLIRNFLIGLDPGYTESEYLQAVNDFMNQARTQFDKTLFIAPGEYTFLNAGDLMMDYSAWKVVSPDMDGFLTLEIVSI